MQTEHSRIVVVGTSGSGKTTIARQLASHGALEHIELDVLHHGPGWQPRDDFATRVAAAVSGDAWVCDGNYSRVREIVWPRATAFVWLDYSLVRTFARGLIRTTRRVASREEVFPGCRETFRGAFVSKTGIPAWILRTHFGHRRTYPELFSRLARGVPVYRLRNPDQTSDFLARVRL